MVKIAAFTQGNHQIDLVTVAQNQAAALQTIIYREQEELSRFLAWPVAMTTVAKEREFLAYAQEKNASGDLLMLTIMVDGQPAGAIDLHHLDPINHHADFGYWLSEEYRGQGIMTAAVQAVEGHAFADLGLHKLTILADVDNLASQGVAKRAGYQPEAILKDHAFLHGGYRDMASFYKVNPGIEK